MKTESHQQLADKLWELRKQYGEYGVYITSHADAMSDVKLNMFVGMLASITSEMNEVQFKLNQF